MKLLFVGDPHIETRSLADAKRLEELVFSTAKAHDVDFMVIAGDLYHTHGVIDAYVQEFWFNFFKRSPVKSLVMKGNHDGPGEEGATATALLAHLCQAAVRVILEPLEVEGLLFCPFTQSNEQFLSWCQSSTARTVFCHQTFDGSKYENGMYAAGGIDPQKVPQKQIISGHIHTAQEFGKVWYPGSPRWRTASDANVDKHIWVLHVENGVVVDRIPIDTSTHCSKIWSLDDSVEAPAVLPAAAEQADVRVVSRGTSKDWLQSRMDYFVPRGVKWRGLLLESGRRAAVRESDGIPKAFNTWVSNFSPKNGTPKEVLDSMVKERLSWE